MEDLLARWTGRGWELEVDRWVAALLAARGSSLLAPAVTVKARFWSVVRRYETTEGPVWLKECNPGQAFEGPLLQVLSELEPAGFARPVGLDARSGRLLLSDAGAVHDRSAGPVTDDDLEAVLVSHAGVQRRLAGHRAALAAAGLPSLLPEQVPSWFERTVDSLASLPTGHPQHLSATARRELSLGVERVRGWSQALSTGAVPASFQHNDLNPGNVARKDGRVVCFDVGDAFWSHPFAVLQLPLAMRTGTWPWGPSPADATVRRHVDAYLEAWTTGGSRLRELRALVRPALLLAQAHRCESWRRLLQHVPADRLGVETPRLEAWLRVIAS